MKITFLSSAMIALFTHATAQAAECCYAYGNVNGTRTRYSECSPIGESVRATKASALKKCRDAGAKGCKGDLECSEGSRQAHDADNEDDEASNK